MKKFLKIFSWFLILMGLLVTLGFVYNEQKSLLCTDLKIIIDVDNGHEFIDIKDILAIVNKSGDSIVGQSIAGIDVGKLEKLIENHPSIANAEVYKTINGEINVKVQQRNPIIRIFPVNNDGFYIDEEGEFMPLSSKYSARVLMANGNIVGGVSTWSGLSIPQIMRNDSLAKKTILDDLFLLADFINKDEFWKAQIQQVYVDTNREIELIPRVGNHRIIIGDVSGLKEKFEKLMIFYNEGLNKTGWNEYHTINLKYQNQIVCTKI
ncbi:MAG: cell division protein FtsQ [Bacteroidetes bacterium]|nr:cell division protein FtsQ [Bacteroidota bacterium]